jgi:hypothetical protein
LLASVTWGIVLVLTTEILSFLRLLDLKGVAIAWLSWNSILVFACIKNHQRLRTGNQEDKLESNIPIFSQLLLGCMILITSTIGLTALISAPNNWDSMTYRLARVVHWIQNRCVDYYPTSYLPQLYQKPLAEYVIMHFQILTGGDRFAALVQWFCMLGSIFGVSLIAKQLGANSRGQILSSLICATIPMGILQGSSTQGDYVISFWIVCFVYFILQSFKDRKISSGLTFQIGASLGLALFTKGTAYIYTFPFFIWFVLSGINRLRWKFWKPLFWIAILVITININHEIRNIDLFGFPLASGSEKYTNDVFGFSIFVSNIIRNISLHLYIPFPGLEKIANALISWIHSFINIGVSDPRTTWPGTVFDLPSGSRNFHEDSAPNTLHLFLIVATIVLFIKEKIFKKEKNQLFYLMAVTSCFLIFCFLLKWQPWHSRLHLPIFVLFSPFVGTIASKSLNNEFVSMVAMAMVLLSLPWVFFNESRPVIFPVNANLSPYSNENIFNSNRVDQYFTNRGELRQPYIEAVSFVKNLQCSNIGLSLRENDYEYPLWMLLKRDRLKQYLIRQINIRNISSEKSDVYPHKGFSPCAVISVNNNEKHELEERYIEAWSKDMVTVFVNKTQ